MEALNQPQGCSPVSEEKFYIRYTSNISPARGILMCKQVPAFLKVQLCALEGLLASGDALSLSESYREGALQ